QRRFVSGFQSSAVCSRVEIAGLPRGWALHASGSRRWEQGGRTLSPEKRKDYPGACIPRNEISIDR
ncbi:MAG: hypothetical protein M3463_12120, partial [Verrucomicrobiota bacterium]|nr:hypothetical protein [Verrucomicrobiota bacterium]